MTGHRAQLCMFLGAFVALLGLVSPVPASDALWTAHVEPLLKERCQECHNATKSKSGLDLTSLQSMLRGGERGPAINPGHPDDSNLYKFLRADADPHMPPGARKSLSDEEIGLIAKWIQELPVIAAPLGQGTALVNVKPTNAPPRITWKPETNLAPAQVIDRFLALAWKLDGIKSAKIVGDGAFARRLYLDLAGRIPTTNELASFLADRRRNKRENLIDSLLAGDDYPRRMRDVFDTVLMTRRPGNWYDRRDNEKWFAFLEDAFRRNRPWNELVQDLIVARPGRPEDRGSVWFLYERESNPQAIAEALAPVVFGVQIKCAQCHDHMVAREIKQAHYWGMVAAFNRSKNVDTPSGPRIQESAIGGFVSFANLKKQSQPAILTFFNGRTVDEVRPKDGAKETDSPDLYLVPPPSGKEKPKQASVPKFSRRAAFADAVTHDNPLLARAMVNRIWAMLMGRGLVHPVDLMDSKHPASHPELLAWLSRDFEQSGYDVKRLVASICRTPAYQLEANGATTRDKKIPLPDAFARSLDKPLSAEQLLASLLVATGNGSDAHEKELRSAFIRQFPDLFSPEYNATLQQALFLSNSSLLDALLSPHPHTTTSTLLDLPKPEDRVRTAFSILYARLPDKDELRACMKYLSGRSPEAGVKQLMWAMLSGAEFQVNH